MTHPKKATARKEGRREGAGKGGREGRRKGRRAESMERWLEWQTMDRWRPRGTKPPCCCCWHCSDAVGCVLVCGGGGAFTVNTQKKSTQKKTTNEEASRDTQHSDAKPQQTVLQESRQVCVYRYAGNARERKRICMRHAMAVKLQQRTPVNVAYDSLVLLSSSLQSWWDVILAHISWAATSVSIAQQFVIFKIERFALSCHHVAHMPHQKYSS